MDTFYNNAPGKITNIDYDPGTHRIINSASEEPNDPEVFEFDFEYDCGIIISSDEMPDKEINRIKIEYIDYSLKKHRKTA